MEQKKVPLSREVAEALEKAKDQFENMPEQVAWCIPDENMATIYGDHWRVLFDYADGNNNGFFQLIDALRYGYYIDEPITVEITADIKEKIRELYKSAEYRSKTSKSTRASDVAVGEMVAIRDFLNVLNLKIL